MFYSFKLSTCEKYLKSNTVQINCPAHISTYVKIVYLFYFKKIVFSLLSLSLPRLN